MNQVLDIPINLKTQNWNSNTFFFISNEEKATVLTTSTLLKGKWQQQRDLLMFLKTKIYHDKV